MSRLFNNFTQLFISGQIADVIVEQRSETTVRFRQLGCRLVQIWDAQWFRQSERWAVDVQLDELYRDISAEGHDDIEVTVTL